MEGPDPALVGCEPVCEPGCDGGPTPEWHRSVCELLSQLAQRADDPLQQSAASLLVSLPIAPSTPLTPPPSALPSPPLPSTALPSPPLPHDGESWQALVGSEGTPPVELPESPPPAEHSSEEPVAQVTIKDPAAPSTPSTAPSTTFELAVMW